MFQFFNSGDERKKMRDESQAPRNSRELAVRNQFFTPRYVVEFLVDNTLGRMWLEMYGESSRLRDLCKYFVRSEDGRPAKAAAARIPATCAFSIPPAVQGTSSSTASTCCSSSTKRHGPTRTRAVRSSATGRTLRDDYPDLPSLKRAAADADPRTQPVRRRHRPSRRADRRARPVDARPASVEGRWHHRSRAAARSSARNIVVAEPMPGDAELVDEFAAAAEPPLLGDLFRRMVSEMRLAGELGTLIPIERAILLNCAERGSSS